MNPDKKQRQAALERLLADSEQFWAKPDTKTLTVRELIDRFLDSTDSSLPEHQRLIFLTDSSHLTWKEVCEVYEYILASDSDRGGKQGIYATWIVYGEAVMKDNLSQSLADRVRIAADVEALIERAARETHFPPETSFGHLYYEHPRRAEQPELYLTKAKDWFDKAIENYGEDDLDFQILGHVHFELGDLKTALYWYERFAAAEDQCGAACVIDRTLAEKRLIECQQRLTEI